MATDGHRYRCLQMPTNAYWKSAPLDNSIRSYRCAQGSHNGAGTRAAPRGSFVETALRLLESLVIL